MKFRRMEVCLKLLNDMKKIYIAQSNIVNSTSSSKGRGVFARKNIKKGEILFIVKGMKKHLVPKNEEDALSGDRWIAVGKNEWIEPYDSNPWFYINHNCTPNSGIKGRVTLRAMRNIRKNEEITLDYSSNEVEPLWWMKCNCNSKNCRGKIKGAKATNLLIIKKYLPFVSNYVKNEIFINNGK